MLKGLNKLGIDQYCNYNSLFLEGNHIDHQDLSEKAKYTVRIQWDSDQNISHSYRLNTISISQNHWILDQMGKYIKFFDNLTSKEFSKKHIE